MFLHKLKTQSNVSQTRTFGLDSRVLAFGLMAMMFSGFVAPAFAGGAQGTAAAGFTKYATETSSGVAVLVDIFAYVSYVLGAVLAVLGISEFRRIGDGSAGGQIAMRQPVAKLGFGGMFLALPYITAIAQDTMTGEGEGTYNAAKAFTFGTMGIKDGALSKFIENGTFHMGVLVDVAAIAAYIIGVFFTVRGLQLLKAHIENPGNAPIAEGLKRLGTGGALFSLPFLVHMVRETLSISGSNISNTGWNTTQGTSGGLDGMMMSFVSDIVNPAYFAIEIFCFVAGVVMILFAMQRMARSAQDGPRGPLGFGTIVMFIVAGLLISFPQLLAALNVSITGSSTALTRVSFMSSSSGDLDQAAKNVFSGVLAFMAVVGFLSVVRGLFMLKTLAEGGQATLMQVMVHFVAGALCINLGALINAIQKTLGLNDFAVTFS